MSQNKTPFFASTTIKTLVNDWQGLRTLIAKTASTQKERLQTDVTSFDNLTTFISERQLQDATLGPFHPLINKLFSSYALLAKIRLKIIITQDDTLNTHIIDKEVALPPHINIKEINIASLDKTQRELDTLAENKVKQWQETVEGWSQQLIMQLTMNEINLSDHEINSFSQQETRSELLSQFTDLKLELPKFKNDRHHFVDYFRLKLILCLHSNLSRQHQPHTMDEINKRLKILKPDFKYIAEQEQALINAQNKEIDQFLPVQPTT